MPVKWIYVHIYIHICVKGSHLAFQTIDLAWFDRLLVTLAIEPYTVLNILNPA